jgi:hypothetical protein
MSNTLLAIMSYAKAEEQVNWSWPHYRKSGLPIMGSCPTNSNHRWPNDCEYDQPLGLEGYSTPELIRRWVGIFNLFTADPMFAKYDAIIVIEYDAVFLKPPPPVPDGVFTHLAGGNIPGFKAERFYHCPWAASRSAATVIAEEGRKMIEEGIFEGGSPDFFLGHIIDRRPDLHLYETGTFSVNGGNLTDRKDAAVHALKMGTWFLHGLRTKEELAWILESSR